ncbi:MAG: hypothetical protein IT386_10735, partial [Deltaproteobacteria bacterium]|nr:hypothetical protein [Deltaproteobacteria bacterium]
GGRTFTPQMLDLAIRCLVAREGELWVCADNYSDGFAIGLSTDGGETFEPRFVYEELAGQVACEADTRSAEVCPVVWRAIVDIFGLDAGPTPPIDGGGSDAGSSRDARPPAMDGARDASASDAFVNPRAPDDGCDCSAAGSGRRGTTLLVLLLGLFLWRIRSRSKLYETRQNVTVLGVPLAPGREFYLVMDDDEDRLLLGTPKFRRTAGYEEEHDTHGESGDGH